MIYVVVGSGPAGVVAAERLRKLDPLANITLIGAEPEPPYSRMAIPYYLTDKIQENGTYLRKTAMHFEKLKIELVQKTVTSIDTEFNRLITDDGSVRRYDKLLLATGASPVVPPVPGIDSPGVHNCWTLEDARHIVKLAKPGASVVLMGAGFIGCIILESLALRDSLLIAVCILTRAFLLMITCKPVMQIFMQRVMFVRVKTSILASIRFRQFSRPQLNMRK